VEGFSIALDFVVMLIERLSVGIVKGEWMLEFVVLMVRADRRVLVLE
jgi:hypothetical protein